MRCAVVHACVPFCHGFVVSPWAVITSSTSARVNTKNKQHIASAASGLKGVQSSAVSGLKERGLQSSAVSGLKSERKSCQSTTQPSRGTTQRQEHWQTGAASSSREHTFQMQTSRNLPVFFLGGGLFVCVLTLSRPPASPTKTVCVQSTCRMSPLKSSM